VSTARRIVLEVTYADDSRPDLPSRLMQLSAHGLCMHDVSYSIVTSLDIDDRRVHERDLIAGYRQRLLDLGVPEPPSLDDLLYEHRLAMAWCLYVGWLSSPTENYSSEISVGNHVRIATAYRDLSSVEAIDSLHD